MLFFKNAFFAYFVVVGY